MILLFEEFEPRVCLTIKGEVTDESLRFVARGLFQEGQQIVSELPKCPGFFTRSHSGDSYKRKHVLFLA